MKHIVSAIVTAMLLAFSTALFAQASSIDLKAGIGYPDAPSKVGFDGAVAVNFGLDKYFNLGVEGGFGWIQWEDKDASVNYPNLNITQVEKANLYSFPLLAVAQIRFADVESDYGFLPFLAGGAGYSWTVYDHPDVSETFSGFTWQVSAGTVFSPGEGSAMKVMLEIGYRGADIENEDSYQLDMSGVFGRIGVSFPIGNVE
ncbi:MAG TPA: outer membrane beta-barrel protein [Spirochaetota bacterium]|nr:porin family protein [Spirochaetota bacterium]HQO39499.1 outer membrane beta-barrel protein [Spirochaetota bacterium]